MSSNLARFDAMRYGLRVGDDGTHSAEEVMALTRAAGFGPEVKRRIMIGTYALSAGYYDAYYNQAQKVRTLIARDLDEAYQSVDVLVSPATPTTAFALGEKVDDPLAMYLFDLCTLPNLAGHCGMSVPSGLSPDDNLPVGLQIMAPALADDRLYRVGAATRLPAVRCRRRCNGEDVASGRGAGEADADRNPHRGGDCPGLNAVIRAVVRTCDARYGSSVVGFLDEGGLAGGPASSSRTTTAATGCSPRAAPCWAPRGSTPTSCGPAWTRSSRHWTTTGSTCSSRSAARHTDGGALALRGERARRRCAQDHR